MNHSKPLPVVHTIVKLYILKSKIKNHSLQQNMWDSSIFPRQPSQIQVSETLLSIICVGIPRTGNNVKLQ